MAETPWDLRRRGLKDSMRHDKRVTDAVKKGLKGLIAEENIITSDGKKLVKIPLRNLDQYRFKYGPIADGSGQGKGKIGDVIAREGDQSGEGDQKAGDQPGDEVYEAEFSVEELIKLMLEDLALRWLEEKDQKQVTTTTYEFNEVRKKGPMANLDKRRFLLENIKRNASDGNPHVGDFTEDDLRFKVWDEKEEFHSNAAVYLLLDRSGSMTTEKKYIAKSFFFWMVRFLKLKYKTVDMVFIAHDTEARIVPERDFFSISNSGGTMCSSALDMAFTHMKQHHPKSSWNNYVFQFSDGDNWDEDNPRCAKLIIEMLEHTAMIGYGEIRYDEANFYGWIKSFDPVWSTLHKELSKIKHERFVTIAIKEKGDVYKALEAFLGKKDMPAGAQK